ncbi:MAG: hypothetical protein D6693_08340 [Planctomycetota bacterium]|nr:MAG: hypothetical protein D6693_08340 [Planctomycetota bacterium]
MLRRALSLVCAAAVIAMTLMLWNATGRAVYTQQYDPDRAAREAASTNDLASQFGDMELPSDSAVSIEPVPNRFRLGLLPSTYPWDIFNPDIVSVLTLATPALLIALMQLTPARFTRGVARRLLARRTEAPSQPAPDPA